MPAFGNLVIMEAAEGQKIQDPYFCTTQWTVILNASQSGPDGQRALERLCESYWYPLYSFARRKGNSPEDAQDLVQGFFAQLLAGDGFAGVASAKGKFRTFLLTSFVYYMTNEWKRANALKRGGAVQFISLNGDDAEGKYKLGPVEHTTPEVLFERSWAETVVARVAAQLREEYERAGDGARFARLKEFLMGGAEARYASTAAELGLSEGGVKTCVRRLRLRFRDLLREELGQTVEDPAEVDSEIRHLLLALAA